MSDFKRENYDTRGLGSLPECPMEEAYIADICQVIPFHCEALAFGMCKFHDEELRPFRCDNIPYSGCSGCKQELVPNPIFDAIKNTLGKKKFVWRRRAWHTECFTCIWCESPIGLSSFVPVGMRGIHVACFEARQKQAVAKEHMENRENLRNIRAKLQCMGDDEGEGNSDQKEKLFPINNATKPRAANLKSRLDIHPRGICAPKHNNTGVRVTKCPLFPMEPAAAAAEEECDAGESAGGAMSETGLRNTLDNAPVVQLYPGGTEGTVPKQDASSSKQTSCQHHKRR